MIIFLHIVIALTSIALATYSYIRPSNAKLVSSYGFIGLTLLSGFYLIWTTPGQMLRGCMTGVAYLVVVTTITVLARQKLTQLQTEITKEN